ncbi:MAG: hypothetical protein ABUT20_54020, partial [Bacteroidota bacterium]
MKKSILCFSIATVVLFSCNNSEQSAPAATETKTDTTAVVNTSVTDQWRIGVQLWTFMKFPFVTAIEKADSAGAKFIEAFPGQKMGGDFGKNAAMGPDLSAADRTKVKDLLKSKGITMVAFGVTGAKD